MGHLATPLFRAYQLHIKYNLNFKNQARVVKFEIMVAIDTRIKKIIKKNLRSKILAAILNFRPKIEVFCSRSCKKQSIHFKCNIISDIDLKNDKILGLSSQNVC